MTSKPAYDPNQTYVTGPEWGVSYSYPCPVFSTAPIEDPRVTLNVYKVDETKINEMGGHGVIIRHEADGLKFDDMDGAKRYAVENGLLVPYVPRALR